MEVYYTIFTLDRFKGDPTDGFPTTRHLRSVEEDVWVNHREEATLYVFEELKGVVETLHKRGINASPFVCNKEFLASVNKQLNLL